MPITETTRLFTIIHNVFDYRQRKMPSVIYAYYKTYLTKEYVMTMEKNTIQACLIEYTLHIRIGDNRVDHRSLKEI